eukprot:6422348-Pyramimonas_sp.AAC.1
MSSARSSSPRSSLGRQGTSSRNACMAVRPAARVVGDEGCAGVPFPLPLILRQLRVEIAAFLLARRRGAPAPGSRPARQVVATPLLAQGDRG